MEGPKLKGDEGAPKPRTVDDEANYEGNDTEVLISRLRNPLILKQVVETITAQEKERHDFIRTEEWIPYLPDGWDGTERYKLLKGKYSELVMSTEDLEKEMQVPLRSTEEIEAEVHEAVNKAAMVTAIDFNSKQPNAEVIPLDWVFPHSGKKPTTKQMSIIEAHEKGHQVRTYHGLTEKFRAGFDLSNVIFTEEYAEVLKKELENQGEEYEDSDKEQSLEEQRNEHFNYYLFTAPEIAERMSQLKNYFGFKGAEVFTKAHLDYARQHYIEDTGMDNGMKLFFQGITSATEDAFIELINSTGI